MIWNNGRPAKIVTVPGGAIAIVFADRDNVHATTAHGLERLDPEGPELELTINGVAYRVDAGMTRVSALEEIAEHVAAAGGHGGALGSSPRAAYQRAGWAMTWEQNAYALRRSDDIWPNDPTDAARDKFHGPIFEELADAIASSPEELELAEELARAEFERSAGAILEGLAEMRKQTNRATQAVTQGRQSLWIGRRILEELRRDNRPWMLEKLENLESRPR